MNSFGDRLRIALSAAGMKPPDLVKRLGLTRAAVKYWLDGKTKHIRPEHLFPLAKLLNVSPEWLSTGAGEKPSDTEFSVQQERPAYSLLGQKEAQELLSLFTSLSPLQRKALHQLLLEMKKTDIPQENNESEQHNTDF